MSLARWIAVAGGLGLSPVAPGTFGSLGGATLFVGMLWMSSGNTVALTGLFLVVVGTLLGLGVWASGRAEAEWRCHDDNRIVIDEVVGQLVALTPLIWLFGKAGPLSWPGFGMGPKPGAQTEAMTEAMTQAISSLSFWVVTGFVLFRLFDVWKPGLIRWAERRFDSGLGVMADDVVAGVYSAVVLVLFYLLTYLLTHFLMDVLIDAPGSVGEIALGRTEWSDALSDARFGSLLSGPEGLA